MDIRVDKNVTSQGNYMESYVRDRLRNFFGNYSFINSVTIFFRGSKHKIKKIKLHARLKGKDLFVEASGIKHDVAFDIASEKLKSQIEKYKSKHFKKRA